MSGMAKENTKFFFCHSLIFGCKKRSVTVFQRLTARYPIALCQGRICHEQNKKNRKSYNGQETVIPAPFGQAPLLLWLHRIILFQQGLYIFFPLKNEILNKWIGECQKSE